MKLTDLLSRARWRAHHSDERDVPTRSGTRLGDDLTDRSSMAELARLLKEADEAQPRHGG